MAYIRAAERMALLSDALEDLVRQNRLQERFG
jgi:hypothetical protein